MTEPLFWNTLPEAADWLTRHVGIVLNVRSLIDAAITSNGVSRGGFIGTFPTLIRARLPRDANFMAVDENASMDELESPTHKLAVAQYGEPRGLKSAYVYGPVGGTTIPLYASDLTELLLRGSVSIQGREGRQIFWHNGSESEQLTEPGRTISGLTFFVMPMGAEVVITPDDCFIDRADLLKLAAKLNNPADDEYRGTNKHTQHGKPLKSLAFTKAVCVGYWVLLKRLKHPVRTIRSRLQKSDRWVSIGVAGAIVKPS